MRMRNLTRNSRRDKIFAVTLDDVQRVVDRYLRSKASALTVIGNAAEVKSLEGWEVVQLQ